MRAIVGWSLKARFIVLALAVGMMFFGAKEVQDAPMDVFPEFAPPKVEVQTIGLGLSAAEVEALVTVPLEERLNGIDDLKTIRSKSVRDLSQIELIFERGTDLLLARQQIAERLAEVTPTLPTWASPPYILQPLSATSRAMKIGLESTDPEMTQVEMSMISYWNIRPRLLGVKGVANVTIYGEQIDMYQVQIDPARMRENGVSIDQVMETTADSLDAGLLQYSDGGFIGTGGFVETPNQRLSIRHISPILGPEALTNLPIKGREDLTLGDVSELVRGHQPLVGDAIINDGQGIMLIVEKFPWANNLDVTEGVEEAMKDLEPGLEGIAVDTTIFRPATFIETSLENLTEALIIASVLVILILVLFLFEWRTALISVVAIPLSLMAAAIVLLYMGTTINVMVLAGLVIAIGVVVDDAIIDVENIWRRLREARLTGDERSTARIVLDASLEVRSSIIHATLLDVVVLLPVFTLAGLSGAFFKPLATSYILAVMASLVVALTVTPAMALLLLSNAPLERRQPIFVRILHAGYGRVLAPIIKHPTTAYLTVAVVVVAGLAIAPGLGSNLLPEFKERDFLMHWVTKPGTSQPEESRISLEACVELREIPGVRNCGAHIGQAFQADEPYGVDFGENWVSVDPSVSYNDTLAQIQETVDGYPGLRRDVQTYLKERIREVLTGSSHPIVIRIFGDDLEVLRTKGDEIKTMLGEIDGVVEEHVETIITPTPQVEVEVNLAAAEKYGLKPGDVRRMVGIMVAGEEAGDMFIAGRAYDVNVWSLPDARHSVDDIGNMLIDTPSGEKIAVKEVAEVRLASTPNAIKREKASRRVDVDAEVEGRSLSEVVSEINERMEEVEFPIGYHAEMLGENEELKSAESQLAAFGIYSAIGVFFILFAAFGTWRLATLSFLTLPSALVGGVLAVYFFNDSILSLGSLVGFLTVFGIAARNKIMLIAHYQHLEREEGMPFGPELILRGAQERLSPILMTACATGLALVPLAIAGDIPGHEVEHPMAVVILGGLITSTLLNLFIVPVLYMHFGKSWNLAFWRRGGSAPRSA
jgi:CzcA family heavy metal efflux pump